MKEIKCNKCGHFETVGDSFAKNIKLPAGVKCTAKKNCSGKMVMVGE